MHEDWATFGVDLHLDVDPVGGRRAGLERALREAVVSGRLVPGTRLPSTRALAAQVGAARGTVSAAFDQLVAEGYLSARAGSGTVVASLPRSDKPAGVVVAADAAPRLDLRPGNPDVSAFPTAAWLRATRRALAAAPWSTYGYGDPRGTSELRTALAEYLRRARGVVAAPERVVVVSGYVQALALLTEALADRASVPVAMEDPGLGLHRDVVRRARGDVVPLGVDEHGARTDLLATPPFSHVRAAVLTPAHQYPMGWTLHPRRRRAAVDWARAVDGLVVEDDYDGEYRYDRQPVGSLQGLAPDHVVYVGTASKTLGPALRLAWMVLPERLVGPVAAAKQHMDLHTETIGQLALAELVTSHAYDRHIRASRLRYRRRRDLLVRRLGAAGATGMSVRGVAAGLHAVVTLPESGPDESDVLAAATSRGLALGSLGGHWQTPGDHPHGIIVGYGTPTEAAFPRALEALVGVLRPMVAGG